jgi:myo-inositol 2-dehydrogenase/D-chiro-inositol 1-dehydrogenase
VGYGLFGAHHARAISLAPNATLVAVAAESDKSRTAARTAHPSVDVYADYRQILDRPDVDIVSVVVPNRLHFPIGRDVLVADKHLFLEKPMALQLDHCDELIALAEKRQRTIAVGHELRLSSLWGRAKQLIDDGVIGDPQYVLVELSRFPYRQGSGGWRYDIERVGSWILEEPIHFFDLAAWYLASQGEPTSIYARAVGRDPLHPELKDHFTSVVNYSSGAHAVISQTLAAFGHHQTAKIAGTKGAVWAWWSAADARAERPRFGLTYGLGAEVTELTIDKPAGELLELADEIVAVAHSVQIGTQPPCTARDGRRSTMLCLAAERSVTSGQVVSLPR